RRAARPFGRERFGETEVEHFHRAVRADFDIRGFQIAVDDALLVRGLQGVGDLFRDGKGVGETKSTFAYVAWGPPAFARVFASFGGPAGALAEAGTPTPRRTGAVPQPRAAALGFGLSMGNQRR